MSITCAHGTDFNARCPDCDRNALDEAKQLVRTLSEDALKYDDGKPRMDLVPARPILAIAEILGYGANKYLDHNWRKGTRWSRYYASIQRHLLAWVDGEDLDPESGLSHLAHAATDLVFLMEFAAKGTGTDDRYRKEQP